MYQHFPNFTIGIFPKSLLAFSQHHYYNFTRYLDPIMVYSFTMGIRVNLVNHMCFCNYGLGIIDVNKTSRGHGIILGTTLQRHMWSHLILMVMAWLLQVP